MAETRSTQKRTLTPEQRQRNNEYVKRYRHAHPEKVAQWRDSYILRRAARLQAEAEAEARGGAEHGD